jgi:hypothetical protein
VEKKGISFFAFLIGLTAAPGWSEPVDKGGQLFPIFGAIHTPLNCELWIGG